MNRACYSATGRTGVAIAKCGARRATPMTRLWRSGGGRHPGFSGRGPVSARSVETADRMTKPTPCIDMRPEHLAIVRDILCRCVPDREVWAFGSRARGTPSPIPISTWRLWRRAAFAGRECDPDRGSLRIRPAVQGRHCRLGDDGRQLSGHYPARQGRAAAGSRCRWDAHYSTTIRCGARATVTAETRQG